MTASYKVLNRLLSHCKWNTRTSFLPAYFSASLFSVLDLSLSLSSQHSKLQKDFYSPLGSIISEKNKTHSQPNLLVKKLLVFHRFSLCPRFLVILLPAQMSLLMMFLIHTMLHALWDPASLVSTFFSSLFW